MSVAEGFETVIEGGDEVDLPFPRSAKFRYALHSPGFAAMVTLIVCAAIFQITLITLQAALLGLTVSLFIANYLTARRTISGAVYRCHFRVRPDVRDFRSGDQIWGAHWPLGRWAHRGVMCQVRTDPYGDGGMAISKLPGMSELSHEQQAEVAAAIIEECQRVGVEVTFVPDVNPRRMKSFPHRPMTRSGAASRIPRREAFGSKPGAPPIGQ